MLNVAKKIIEPLLPLWQFSFNEEAENFIMSTFFRCECRMVKVNWYGSIGGWGMKSFNNILCRHFYGKCNQMEEKGVCFKHDEANCFHQKIYIEISCKARRKEFA